MNFLAFLQQSRPILCFHLLLPQNQLHPAGSVVRLGVLRVDLCIEFQFDMVVHLLGLGVTREVYTRGVDLEFGGGIGYIRNGKGDVEDVFSWVRTVGALSPQDWRGVASAE